MDSNPELFALYAAQCRRRAETTSDRTTRRLFSDLAVQWLELASLARTLQIDRKDREQFFKDGVTRYSDA
jgi:hypothetical protein